MEITARDIPLGDLHESPWNPRKHFPPKPLEELAQSIREVGVLTPLVVRPRKAGGYEIAAGHRRKRAAALAKVATVPAIIRELTDQQMLEVLTIENMAREDVHPLDEGEGYRTLMKQTGWDVDTVAAKVGKSKSYVYQRLKLAELIPAAKKALLEEQITAGHAILIARLTPKDQKEALEHSHEHWGDKELVSVRELARWIEREIHLDLHAASFKKDDATLLPEAGPCTTCPKRTGFLPDLFPDVTKKDACTDRACFKAKTQAFSARVIAEAEASGEELLRLSGGWSNRSPKPGAPIPRGRWDEAKPRSCPHVKRGILIEDGQGVAGRILTVCAEPTCKKHRGYVRTAEDLARDERSRRDAKRAHETRSRETERRRRILGGIREQVTAKLTRADLELIALEYFCDLWSDLRKPLMKLEGWSKDGKGAAYREDETLVAKKIPAMSDVELARFLVTTSLMKTCEVPAYGPGRKVDGLLEAAKRWGVDVAAIDKRLKMEADDRARARGIGWPPRGRGSTS